MAENTFERVQKVVCNVLKANPAEVTLTASFQEDLGADSLDVVELVMALEEEFGSDIPDNTVAELKTVGDVVEYIDRQSA